MVFMVSDQDDLDELEDEGAEAEQSEGEGEGGKKAQLDQGDVPRAAQKVDLDLDDAPFLEEEEEEEEEEEHEEEEGEEVGRPAREKKPLPAWIKNKFIWIGAAAGILIIAAAVKFLFFMPSAPPAPEQPQEVAEAPPPAPEPTPAAEPEPLPEPETEEGETLLRMDPFWVEQEDEKGNIRFLVARFALTTTNELLAIEFNRKTTILRDAMFYYLKNKNLQFLSDKNNSEQLKTDLLTVMNQYMSAGRFENLLIEQYLVK